MPKVMITMNIIATGSPFVISMRGVPSLRLSSSTPAPLYAFSRYPLHDPVAS
jgi:hypothetical protein